jgi:hypothetical protein
VTDNSGGQFFTSAGGIRGTNIASATPSSPATRHSADCQALCSPRPQPHRRRHGCTMSGDTTIRRRRHRSATGSLAANSGTTFTMPSSRAVRRATRCPHGAPEPICARQRTSAASLVPGRRVRHQYVRSHGLRRRHRRARRRMRRQERRRRRLLLVDLPSNRRLACNDGTPARLRHLPCRGLRFGGGARMRPLRPATRRRAAWRACSPRHQPTKTNCRDSSDRRRAPRRLAWKWTEERPRPAATSATDDERSRGLRVFDESGATPAWCLPPRPAPGSTDVAPAGDDTRSTYSTRTRPKPRTVSTRSSEAARTAKHGSPSTPTARADLPPLPARCRSGPAASGERRVLGSELRRPYDERNDGRTSKPNLPALTRRRLRAAALPAPYRVDRVHEHQHVQQ